MNAYVASLGDNPYFGAGAGLFGMGMLATVARRASVVLNTFVRRRYMLQLEVTNDDMWVVE